MAKESKAQQSTTNHTGAKHSKAKQGREKHHSKADASITKQSKAKRDIAKQGGARKRQSNTEINPSKLAPEARPKGGAKRRPRPSDRPSVRRCAPAYSRNMYQQKHTVNRYTILCSTERQTIVLTGFVCAKHPRTCLT